MDPERAAQASPAAAFLAGPGELAMLMRGFDWRASALGPVEAWPNSLRSTLRILLGSSHPMWLVWGPQLTFFYNDALVALARLHPRALGRPASQAWPQIWPVLAARVQAVLATGAAARDEDLLLFLERGGYREETYHSLSYSPLADDAGRLAGTLCVVSEQTQRVLHARRLHCLRDLATALASTLPGEALLPPWCRVLAEHARDLPFTLTYRFENKGRQARLACATGTQAGAAAAPERMAVADSAAPWPAQAVRQGRALLMAIPAGLAPLPATGWDRPPSQALVLPLSGRARAPAGFIVVGLNPFRPYEASYREFLDVLAAQVSAGLAGARAGDDGAAREDEAREVRFRRYFDLGLIGMALTSPVKGCIEVNDELCRILGYPHEELLHKQWPALTHPDDLAADVTQFDRVMTGEQDGYVLDKRFIRKDGRVVWCTMAAKCLRARDGSVEYFVALVQDMTEQLAADDALRRARDQLAHMTRVGAMGQLVASIAHEMNQPLAAIAANGNASVRWLTATPPNEGEALAAIDRIVADAHRASEVIARIRDFLRRKPPEREAVDLCGVLSDVAGMLEREARARQVRLQVAPARGEPVWVIGDRVQLQQVVLNLVMNGFEAMAAVPEAQRLLQMWVAPEGPRAVRVSVRDAGVGVDPQERDRIFDPFYTSKPAGTGMGLAISRSIVDAHAGRLWCTPNEQGGETFSFSLPA